MANTLEIMLAIAQNRHSLASPKIATPEESISVIDVIASGGIDGVSADVFWEEEFGELDRLEKEGIIEFLKCENIRLSRAEIARRIASAVNDLVDVSDQAVRDCVLTILIGGT